MDARVLLKVRVPRMRINTPVINRSCLDDFGTTRFGSGNAGEASVDLLEIANNGVTKFPVPLRARGRQTSAEVSS